MFFLRFVLFFLIIIQGLYGDVFYKHKEPIHQDFADCGFMITPYNPLSFSLPSLNKGRIVRVDLSLGFFEDDENPSHFCIESHTGEILGQSFVSWSLNKKNHHFFYHQTSEHSPQITLKDFGNGQGFNIQIKAVTLTPCGFHDTYAGNKQGFFYLPEEYGLLWNDFTRNCSAVASGIILNNQRTSIYTILQKKHQDTTYIIDCETMGGALTLAFEDENSQILQVSALKASNTPQKHQFTFKGPLHSLSFEKQDDQETFLRSFQVYTPESHEPFLATKREFHIVPFENLGLPSTLTINTHTKEKSLSFYLPHAGNYQLCFYNEGFGDCEVSVNHQGKIIGTTTLDQRPGFIRLELKMPVKKTSRRDSLIESMDTRPIQGTKPKPASSLRQSYKPGDPLPLQALKHIKRPNTTITLNTKDHLDYMQSREIAALKIATNHSHLFKDVDPKITCFTTEVYPRETPFQTFFLYSVIGENFLIEGLKEAIFLTQSRLQNNSFHDANRQNYDQIYLEICKLFKESAEKIALFKQEDVNAITQILLRFFNALNKNPNLDHWALLLQSFCDILEDQDVISLTTWSSRLQ